MSHKNPFCRAGLLLAASLAITHGAFASPIAGKVILSGAPTAGVVISIEGLTVAGAPDGNIYVVDHRDLNFVPHVLVVRVGTTVAFKNSDGMPCHIYSISPAGTFVLRREDGKPMRLTFDRPGVIEVRCAEHSRIYAFVVVKENPYFALSDSKGRYKIPNVPAGRYTMEAWYEGKVIQSKSVEVGARKLKVDFKAARPQHRALSEKPADLASLSGAAEFRAAGFTESSTLWRKKP